MIACQQVDLEEFGTVIALDSNYDAYREKVWAPTNVGIATLTTVEFFT